jgi:BirA family biotin operon repressor/biotin-[acetyl-CoA-carboxylase] ligase
VSTDLPGWLHAVRQGVAQAAPRAGAFAQHVLVLPTTRSTNDDVARASLEGAPEGYTVVAAEQTAGRGRRGASWHSPATCGLYLSTLLRPDRWPAVRDSTTAASSLVTLMAGVAVASAVRDVCDAPVELKWPNDVVVRSRGDRPKADGRPTKAEEGLPTPGFRKLAGILAEGASDGHVLRSVVLGIGVNLRPSEAPPDVALRMISLHELGGASAAHVPVEAIVASLLVRLRDGCERLSRGDLTGIRSEWRRLAPSVDGTTVRWHHQGIVQTGHAIGIDDTGALRVRTAEAREVTVHGGDVEWLLDACEA